MIIRVIRSVFIFFVYGLDELTIGKIDFLHIGKIWKILFFWRRYKQSRALRLRLALQKLGPIYVKFGQILSVRRDIIPADIIAELIKLQEQVPPEPFSYIDSTVKEQLGSQYAQIASISQEPIGSASVAQVHHGYLVDGREIAIKVLRKNIKSSTRKDIKAIMILARLISILIDEHQRLQLPQLVEQFDYHLRREMDMRVEAASCMQMRTYCNNREVVIPEVYLEYCREKVLIMQYIEHTDIFAHQQQDNAEQINKKIIETCTSLFLTQVFEQHYFHADLHPGNLKLDAQGRIVLFDFGIIGELSNMDTDYLARNLLFFLRGDFHAVAKMHVTAGWMPPNTKVHQFEADLRAVCSSITEKAIGEISFGQLLLDLFRVAHSYQLTVQPQLFMLQKTLVNLEGIARSLDPKANIWQTAYPFLTSWARRKYSLRTVGQELRKQAPDLLLMLDLLPQISTRLRTPEPPKKQPHAIWKPIAILALLALASVPFIL